MVLLGLLTAFLSGCGNSTPSSVSSASAPADDTPAGLRAAAISWADAFLTGTAADIYKMQGAECRTSSNPNSSTATAYLRGLRVEMERHLAEPLASINVTGVQVRNFTVSSGEAEVQYDLPAAKVGNDNWVAYDYEAGQWKVSNCHAPIGGESSSSSASASASAP
jgi:hypothetical protein